MRFAGTKKKAGSEARSNAGIATAVVVVALLGFASVSCDRAQNPLGIELKIEKRKLDNGLKVIFVEDHSVPVVSYQTWYKVGSVDEKPGITGISHLFEHLMFKGTPKYGPRRFFQELEAKGAEVNAYTTRDYTVYHQSFMPSLLERVIDMESDRMSNLTLDEEVLKNERLVVFEERRLRTDNSAEGRIQEALWGLAYRRHPYNWPVIGWPQDLATITLPQVVEYYKTHYQPANATLVVTGDFDRDRTWNWIKQYYSPIPGRKPPGRKGIEPEPEQREERRLSLTDEVASEQFAMAYHITSAHDEDSYAMDVLANVLFAGTSSRANQLLVERKNVALGVSGSSYTPDYAGLFIITGMMKKGVPVEEAEKLLDQLIREAQDTQLDPEEIRVAVKQLTVQVLDSIRTPHGLGILIGTVDTILGDPDGMYDDVNKYLKVTAADVQRVARKYLVPNNRTVITLSPKVAGAAAGTQGRKGAE